MSEKYQLPSSHLLSAFYDSNDYDSLNLFFIRYQYLLCRVAFYLTKEVTCAEQAVIQLYYHILKKNLICQSTDLQEPNIKSWLIKVLIPIVGELKGTAKTDYAKEIFHKKISHKENLKQILILQALLQQPDKMKLPLILIYREDFNYLEIGRITGADQTSLKRNINQSIDLLKLTLKESGIILTSDLLAKEIKQLRTPEFSSDFESKINPGQLANAKLDPVDLPMNTQKYMQWVTISVLAIPIIFGLIFLTDEIKTFANKNSEQNDSSIQSEEVPPKPDEPIKLIPIKNYWDFQADAPEGFHILRGSWLRFTEGGYMKTTYNATTLIQTPIRYENNSKPVILQFKGFIFNPFPDREIASRLCGYLVSNNKTVKYTFKNFKTQTETKKLKIPGGVGLPLDVKILVDQRGIFVFDKYQKLVNAMYFSETLPPQSFFVLSLDNIYTRSFGIDSSITIVPTVWDDQINSTIPQTNNQIHSEELPTIKP